VVIKQSVFVKCGQVLKVLITFFNIIVFCQSQAALLMLCQIITTTYSR